MSDSGAPEGAEVTESDSTYWHLRSGGKEIGPIMMSRLRQMARQGEVSADDQVRKGKTGNWVAAGSVSGLLIREVVAAEPFGDEADAEELPNLPPTPGPLARFLEATLGGGADLFDGGLAWLGARLGLVRVVVSWVALAAVVFALAQMGVGRSFWERWFRVDPYLTFTSIREELVQIRSRNVTTAEWDAFAERVRRDIKPLVARLEKSAGTDNRQDQQLLWAGRDCLPKMLIDAREEGSYAEKKFVEHLQNVAYLRDGRDLFGGTLRRQNILGGWSLNTISATELGAALFGLVDIAVVVWLFRMWRGRGKRT